jgi:hypothetical protein
MIYRTCTFTKYLIEYAYSNALLLHFLWRVLTVGPVRGLSLSLRENEPKACILEPHMRYLWLYGNYSGCIQYSIVNSHSHEAQNLPFSGYCLSSWKATFKSCNCNCKFTIIETTIFTILKGCISWCGEMRVEKQEFACREFESWEARVCMKVDESWEARVCMKVDESWEARVCMRVEKREFAWELMRVEKREFAWELMRVEKREFAWKLRSESLNKIWWELRNESLHDYESFLNSHAPVKREQELTRLRELNEKNDRWNEQ